MPIVTGEHAFLCAQVADVGGQHAALVGRLAEYMEHPDISPQIRQFVAWIARQCSEVAAQNPNAPGDAILAAFERSGWCHRLGHGNAVQMRVRIAGAPQLTPTQRADARNKVADALLDELQTHDAVFVAHHAGNTRDGSYWARRWAKLYAGAMTAAFEGVPPDGARATSPSPAARFRQAGA
ncbi:MAG: hypothetical protein DI587_36370 [Variovorax paradoxus]|nr:MAG: hypothetical protein DI583_36370 [Variovorax paradoxus]PZQ00782.1 MAG: hypothetical protein DI587_36370 [Variovorax paradoxus]